jgi:tRNA (cytidine/uridine-2'-O-)-methyltransferase
MEKENFNIVLVHPQIPNNTGNIGRLCVGSQSKLHLVKPLGFEITDTRVKRAGLDYWGDLDLSYYDDFEALLQSVPDLSRMFFFTTRTQSAYYDVNFKKGDWLVFGRESDGLPPEIVEHFSKQCVKIPFPGKVRSFNLSNAVSIALGEGLRQFR